jgi:mannose-6-phosphate isomerase-like protein (cupin superfamily)
MRFPLIMALTAAAATASAQAPEQAQKTFTSAADVTSMIAKARSERKPDQPNFIQPLLRVPGYAANLEYRVKGVDTTPNVHEHEAELVYVIEGGGTFTLGGKLRDERRLNANNVTGSAIDGGTPRHIAKGDFIMVPENTAHGFTETDGTLVIMSLHVPGGGPAR